MRTNPDAALAVIFRLYSKHRHSPFWLPSSEFPPVALGNALHQGWLLKHDTRGRNFSLQITKQGAQALDAYQPHSEEKTA